MPVCVERATWEAHPRAWMQWPTQQTTGRACGNRQGDYLLLVIIFNFSYKNLDVYQYCLSLVLLLMFFISVSLVFKSQTAGTQQRSSTAAKGQSQALLGGHSAQEGLRRCGQQAGHAQPAPARCLQGLWDCPRHHPGSGPRKAPTALGPDSLLSPLLARPCSSGGPLAQSNARAPWPRSPRRTHHTAPCQEANSPGS